MRSQLLNPGRGFWTSRAIAMAAIVAIHGVLATVMLLSGTVPFVEPHVEPIQVALMTEQPETAPPPRIPLQEMQFPTPVIPIVSIDLNEDPPPTITVAAAPQAAPAPVTDAGAPIMATTVEYVRRPVLHYPPEARRARATGTVQVRALVEVDGQVRDVRVHRSSGHSLLDRAACESVREALFKPYMLNGTARAALVIVPIDFNLTMRTASR